MSNEKHQYPEHHKLGAISDKSQAIYDFLEWVRGEHGLLLASYATSSSPLEQGRLFPSQHSVRRLLAEFFEIDEEKIEQEKRAMLEGLRG